MKFIYQKSNKNKIWFDLEVIENNGKISIPAGKFYLQGKEYDLGEVKDLDFPVGSRLYIEKTDTGADYLVDYTQLAEPNSFGEGIGAPLICANENGEIWCLRHIQE
jgi:hypothetical protein